MNAIILDYDPFVMESKIIVTYDNKQQRAIKVQSQVDKIAEVLTGLAYSNNIYNIKVNGKPEIINEIKKNVQEYESSLYSYNKIIVEGI